ncbi:MAG: FAD-dependent oxidoreductase [Burkholderiaceae bacterium]|nr:FAD-dependent oxidoreductase [Burkholderiaceae bacterium]
MPAKARTVQFRPWRQVHAPPRSLWLQEALRLEEDGHCAPLLTTERADVCIIGGGYTGLWTALRLLERDPGLSIVLLEADICGSGASGRNSGAIGSMAPTLPMMHRRLGDQGAATVHEAGTSSEKDIIQACKTYGIDANLRQTDHIWVADTASVVDGWQETIEIARRLGSTVPYRILRGDELGERVRQASPGSAGLYTPVTTYLQPARLARGLRRTIIKLGARVCEHTPVTELILGRDFLRVLTPSGTVNCDKVVLAANAWMAHLSEFRKSVMVLSSDMVATNPIVERIRKAGLEKLPRGRRNSRLMVNYGRVKDDGTVYMGRAGGTLAYDAHVTPSFDRSWAQTRELMTDFRYLYPELEGAPLPHWWAGAVDRSGSGMPFFGHLRDEERVLFGIGYTGHGVMATSQGGHILADMCLERQSEWTELAKLYCALQGDAFPPEPMRYWGGRVVRSSLARKEHAEREHRPASVFDRLVSKLAASTLPMRSVDASGAPATRQRGRSAGTRLG